jgi:septum formation protein
VKNISNRTQGLPVENDRSSPWLLIRIRRFKAVMALLGGSVLLQRTIAPAMSRAFVYLASQSPRRQQLLQQLGVRFELLLPDASEDAEALEALRPAEGAEAYVRRVTRAKLAAARERVQRRGLPAAPLLSADTTVAIGRTILGKPADADEASAMLARLSGRWHRVVSGVAVAHGARSSLALNVSRVRFAKLPRVAIEAYVASGEPFGKAGAYAIQSALAGWIERIDGSHSGIMGLPLFETAQLLRRAGVPTALSE